MARLSRKSPRPRGWRPPGARRASVGDGGWRACRSARIVGGGGSGLGRCALREHPGRAPPPRPLRRRTGERHRHDRSREAGRAGRHDRDAGGDRSRARAAGGRGASPMPVLPGLLVAGGLALLPTTRTFWWAGLLVDPSVPSTLYTIALAARGGWRRLRLRRADDRSRSGRGGSARPGCSWSAHLQAAEQPPSIMRAERQARHPSSPTRARRAPGGHSPATAGLPAKGEQSGGRHRRGRGRSPEPPVAPPLSPAPGPGRASAPRAPPAARGGGRERLLPGGRRGGGRRGLRGRRRGRRRGGRGGCRRC
jgi:hypothetical protein